MICFEIETWLKVAGRKVHIFHAKNEAEAWEMHKQHYNPDNVIRANIVDSWPSEL